MVIAYSGSPYWLGGTLTIMLLAYLIRVVPQSFTYVHAGFKQVNVETEEAARVLGASWSESMRRVTIPLLRGRSSRSGCSTSSCSSASSTSRSSSTRGPTTSPR
ncbi:hypothetical protein [Blastococcus brunescens]|uniref:ABC transmembrane type-1 domain-containing protein n=1 Tax=Blastococcus brunescens TaxID=1564165 RepID=A0ABZ1AUN8_9ACTN|nr:hypothetical protein [Blastococcus sp. BMG 8361]WRL62291.1 hypothetical protein U6N30_19920 [Blastococcus sp. BMG 8361]